MEVLNQRYATKMFDANKKISDTDFNALLESLRLSPSSFGLQPWKFIVAQNPAVRAKLKEVSWNQAQVTDASHYIVLASRKSIDIEYVQKYVTSTENIRHLPAGSLQGYNDMMVGAVAKGKTADEQESWTKSQTYLALGFIGFAAAALWIDTCMIEGFDPKAYDEILELKNTDYQTVVAIAIGYRSEDDKTAQYVKSRFDTDEVIQTI